jgi:Ca2+-binding EF-hand superfamily protein
VPQEQIEMAKPMASRLFDLFDADNNGVVDFCELASALSVLCGGSRDEKVEAAFALYDINGDGYISLDEMTTYLTSVFKVLYETQPGTAERMGVSAEELAAVTAEQAFVDADLNHDGKLSFDEFKKWYAEPEHQSGGALAEETNEMSLAKARQLTNLQSYSVEDAFEMFAEYADEDGCLSRSAFNSCFRHVIKSGPSLSTADKRAVEAVVDRLFEIFDSNNDGSLDFSELASGLSVLCGGNREDKVEAAFALYDLDGDGSISLDEMTTYLT